MRIICEHCGSNINILSDTVCPNCKAPYNKNKEFLKFKDEVEQRKKDGINISKEFMNRSKKIPFIFVGVAVFFIIVFVSIFVLFGLTTRKVVEKVNDEINDNVDNVIINDEDDEFTFEYTDVEFSNDLTFNGTSFHQPNDGYTYVLFKVSIKNNSNEKIYLNDSNFICTIDDVVQENVTFYAHDYKELPTSLESGLIAEGYVAYEVPEGSKSFDLRYNNKTIHIDAN